MHLTVDNQVDRDEIELLVNTYVQLFDSSFPRLEPLYKKFIQSWEQETVEFLHTNRDAYQLEELDFEHIEEELGIYGFRVPSLEDICRWLDLLQMIYMTERGEVINSPLVSIW